MPASPRSRTSPSEFGSQSWYEKRWRTRWATLRTALESARARFDEKLYMELETERYNAQNAVAQALHADLGAQLADAGAPWSSDQEVTAAFQEVQKLHAQYNARFDASGMLLDGGSEYPQYATWPNALTQLKQIHYHIQRTDHARQMVADLLFFAEAIMNVFCDGLFHGRQVALQQIDQRLRPEQPLYAEPRDVGHTNLIEALEHAVNIIDFTPGDVPANYALRMLIEQISIDLEIVHAAIRQREQQLYAISSLQIADEFAQLPSSPAMAAGFSNRKM
ncbi:MAG: hypothetical protein R2911_15530 [Caldilineaceae bacterium]